MKSNLIDFGIRTICNNQPGHFNFYKNQVILCVVFVSAVVAKLVYTLMYLRDEYPLPDDQLSESYLTQYIGISRDSHDMQWQSFRGNLFVLLGFMLIWKVLYDKIALFREPSMMISFGVGFTIFSYRGDFIFYICLLVIWYNITKYLHSNKLIIPFCWVTTVFILYYNEKYDHLRSWSVWLQDFIPIQSLKNREAPILWTNMLNMTLLKLLSFTIDCHRGDQKKQYLIHKNKCKQGSQCYQCRDLSPLPKITFKNFCEYIFFAPTFFAGPPIAYKNFHSFKAKPTTKKPQYLRCLFLFISFELWHHFIHCVKPNQKMTLFQIWDLGLFNLMFIWYKFSVIWKISKLWSSMMGIDVIDNMGRCVLNNYGFERFWRMWHKGFNHWLIRYLYIPCGGNKSIFSTILVVGFVSFWHDHTINILFWGFILAIFMVPQFAVKSFFRKHYLYLYPKQWFKYLCAIICSFYIQVLCTCNLIGFGYTLSQAIQIYSSLLDSFLEFLFIQIVLTSASIIMFYIREVDGRKD